MLDLGRGGGAVPSINTAATAAAAAAETNGVGVYANNSGGNGNGDVDVSSRASSDIVVVERCHERHHEQLLTWNKALCESLRRDYDQVGTPPSRCCRRCVLPPRTGSGRRCRPAPSPFWSIRTTFNHSRD
ncbi:unnamed protein product [Hapterophycus canaliculatus]